MPVVLDISIGSVDQSAGVGTLDIHMGDASVAGSMLDFTIPTHNVGAVLLILFVRDAEVLPAANASSWTKVIDGEGASGFFLDGYARLSDGTDQSRAGDVVSFASLTTQDLLGSLIEVTQARVVDVIEGVAHGAFLADSNPAAPGIDSFNRRNVFLTVFASDSVVTFAPPTGHTEVEDYSNSGSPTNSLGIAQGDAEIVGEIDPGSATLSAAADGRAWTVMLHYAAPASTYDALAAGGTSNKFVVAMEGYDYLFTDATSAQAVNAWNGLDWTQALVGCTVNCVNDQSLDPWQPFHGGGRLTLHVPAQSAGNTEAADPFGVAYRRKTSGNETYLDETIDCRSNEIATLNIDGFDAEGTFHIGTEAIGYTSIVADSVEDAERGKWAPFGVDVDEGDDDPGRFGHRHSVLVDPNEIPLQPLVTEHRRIWNGRWIGLWRHLYSHQNSLLNIRDDAQLEFAGRVVEVADDPTTMRTVVHCEHALDVVRGRTIGENIWQATLREGVKLEVGQAFDILDYGNDQDSATLLTANSLDVIAGVPANVNEIQAGVYSIDDLMSRINTWLAAEEVANRLNGIYWLSIAEHPTQGLRSWFNARIAGAGPFTTFEFRYPTNVDFLFGRFPNAIFSGGRMMLKEFAEDDVDVDWNSSGPPLRCFVDFANDLEFENVQGTFVEHDLGSVAQNPLANGIFAVEGVVFSGKLENTDEINFIGPTVLGSLPLGGLVNGETISIAYDDPRPEIAIRQILAIEGVWADIVKQLFYSTGASGYNHATYDTLPAQLGLGIPGEILGDVFNNSVDQIPGALDTKFTLVLDEPKSIVEILTGTLIFRWSFLRWKDGHLEFCTWSTPTTGIVLEEGNKASPASVTEHNYTSTVLTSEWATSRIKVDYDRDPLASGSNDGFRSSRTVVDKTAVDDSGRGGKLKTIQLRDSYGTEDVLSLLPQFAAGAAMFTRDFSKILRTISSKLFETVAVGDSVIVGDNYAGDPETGLRGVAARPGLVIRHTWSLGGPQPNGGTAEPFGEVEVMFKDVLRIGKYVPTAQLDDTATNSGYVIGTKVATCYAHAHSEATEDADATWFPVGAKVKFVEIDPANPAAPDTHDDTVAAQSGDTITLTTGFAGFDNTKRYRIVSDHYADASTLQQGSFTYQADASDGKIQDLRVPFDYVATNLSGTSTANAADDQVELPPDISYADGFGRDVGHEAAINRLINNLIDYKTAGSHPYLQQTEMSGASLAGPATWLLADATPMNLTKVQMTFIINRLLTVAPFMKSADGASASVRVTLARSRPSGSELVGVDRGAIYGEATFTTTSTTYATATAQTISMSGIPDSRGDCWLLIEVDIKARTYGLATCQVGPRTL